MMSKHNYKLCLFYTDIFYFHKQKYNCLPPNTAQARYNAGGGGLARALINKRGGNTSSKPAREQEEKKYNLGVTFDKTTRQRRTRIQRRQYRLV